MTSAKTEKRLKGCLWRLPPVVSKYEFVQINLVLVAVEKRGRNMTGRARMEVIPDFRSETLTAFLKNNVAPGSTVYTDGLKSFTGLNEAGFQHVPRSQPLRIDLRKGAKSVVPLADRAFGNLQQWLVGTHHGVSRDQLQTSAAFRPLSWRLPRKPAWVPPTHVSSTSTSPRSGSRFRLQKLARMS